MTIQSVELKRLLSEDLRLNKVSQETEFFPGIDLRDAFAVSINKSLVQKWSSGLNEKTKKAALDKFLARNEACGNWQPPSQYDSKTEMLMNHLKQVIWSFWTRRGYDLVDHPFEVLERGSIGPGANLQAHGGDFYSKFFSSPLTSGSSTLYNWYSRYISKFPDWWNAEVIRTHEFGEPVLTNKSKLSFVPKNDEISRCICIEPTLNTFFQLGFAHHLEDRLKERFGISLTEQPFLNRDLARLGSITDNLVTLDLSSASDSISLRMLKHFLPTNFIRWLEMFRSTHVDVPGVGAVELHMVSTMGNGYTFPLQTMLFSAVVLAALNFRGIPCDRKLSTTSWGVFGDDIICPREVHEDVITLLTLLGFIVNEDKSFVRGPFRESCGADFFLGTDIRGIYLKDLRTMASRYAAINQLIRFETRSGIALPNLIGRLLKTVKLSCVPRSANIDSGIQSPRPLLHYLKDKDTQSVVYYGLEPRPKKIRIKDDSIVVPRRHKPLIYNPEGLLMAVLYGSIHNSSIGIREDLIRYSWKRRVTPYWEFISDVKRDRPDYELDWQRWESVVRSYLEIG